ncbi:glycosyltransferase family 4 protein [bacterium]|nr:glycosyltransferase family 4 protein [bacterium]
MSNIYLGLRNIPGSNSGGPGAVAKLLASSLLAPRRDEMGVRALIDKKVFPLSCLTESSFEAADVVQSRLQHTNFWALLQARPNSLQLNLAHAISQGLRRRHMRSALRANAVGGPTVVHAFGLPIVYQLHRYKTELNLRLVHEEHSKGGYTREFLASNPHFERTRFAARMKEMEVATVQGTDLLIFPSHGAQRLFLESHPTLVEPILSKSVIIYNAIPDPYSEVGQGDIDSRNIFNVAQHVPEKGIKLFLEGASRFISELEDDYSSEAINVGAHTALTPELIAFRDQLPAANRILFQGKLDRTHLLEKMRRCWAVVTSTEVAVFDLALLEAMALKKPIIATPVGGNLEALGEDYPLYARNAQEIHEKLQLIHREPGLAEAIGTQNRNRFLQRFTLEPFVDSRISLWEKLIQDS